MSTTIIKYRLLKPVLSLYGPGERGPGGGGPASFPGEEPLLPRLETLIGAAGVAFAEKNGFTDYFMGTDTYEEYLERIEDLLGLGRGVFIGPFLLVEAHGRGEEAIYVDVGTGLLKIIEYRGGGGASFSEAYRKYSEHGRILRGLEKLWRGEALLEPPSSLFRHTSPYTPAASGDGSSLPGYVAREDILLYRTGIALNRGLKSAEEHMIYTLPRIDYSTIHRAPNTSYTLIVLHTGPGNGVGGGETGSAAVMRAYGGVSVKQAPAVIEAAPIRGSSPAPEIIEKIMELLPPLRGVLPELERSGTYLAISPTATPVAEAYHPVLGRPAYMRLGRTFTTGKLFRTYRKGKPLTALSPGNLFIPEPGQCGLAEAHLVKYIKTIR